jgi:hypothetical protein
MTHPWHLNAHRGFPHAPRDGVEIREDSFFEHTGPKGHRRWSATFDLEPETDDSGVVTLRRPDTEAGSEELFRAVASSISAVASLSSLKRSLIYWCEGLHLPTGGSKAELVKRLREAARR